MRWMDAARACGRAMCVVLFGVLTACGLNLAERAQNDLIGVDRPASCLGIERVAEHGYLVHLLGTSYSVDLGDGFAAARWAWLKISLVAREGARRAAAAAKCAARVFNEACTRLRARLGDPWAGVGCGNARQGGKKDVASCASKRTLEALRVAAARS